VAGDATVERKGGEKKQNPEIEVTKRDKEGEGILGRGRRNGPHETSTRKGDGREKTDLTILRESSTQFKGNRPTLVIREKNLS